MNGWGIGGENLKWIYFSLSFRQQRVVVKGAKSDWAPVCLVSHTVHRALSLAPFSLYIYHISTHIDSEIRHFADECVCRTHRLRFLKFRPVSVHPWAPVTQVSSPCFPQTDWLIDFDRVIDWFLCCKINIQPYTIHVLIVKRKQCTKIGLVSL